MVTGVSPIGDATKIQPPTTRVSSLLDVTHIPRPECNRGIQICPEMLASSVLPRSELCLTGTIDIRPITAIATKVAPCTTLSI